MYVLLFFQLGNGLDKGGFTYCQNQIHRLSYAVNRGWNVCVAWKAVYQWMITQGIKIMQVKGGYPEADVIRRWMSLSTDRSINEIPIEATVDVTLLFHRTGGQWK